MFSIRIARSYPVASRRSRPREKATTRRSGATVASRWASVARPVVIRSAAAAQRTRAAAATAPSGSQYARRSPRTGGPPARAGSQYSSQRPVHSSSGASPSAWPTGLPRMRDPPSRPSDGPTPRRPLRASSAAPRARPSSRRYENTGTEDQSDPPNPHRVSRPPSCIMPKCRRSSRVGIVSGDARLLTPSGNTPTIVTTRNRFSFFEINAGRWRSASSSIAPRGDGYPQ